MNSAKTVLSRLGRKFSIEKCIVNVVPLSIRNSLNREKAPLAIVIENVLSPEECLRWISETEQVGYEEALVNIGGGKQIKKTDVRKGLRCIIDDHLCAKDIWERIKMHIPVDYVPLRIPVEVNGRLRFLRYDVGEYFAPHRDGSYRHEATHPQFGDGSRLTLQVYLNEGFEGGATRFFCNKNAQDEEEFYDVIPKTGSVLIFDHGMKHSGEMLISGRKYAL